MFDIEGLVSEATECDFKVALEVKKPEFFSTETDFCVILKNVNYATSAQASTEVSTE